MKHALPENKPSSSTQTALASDLRVYRQALHMVAQVHRLLPVIRRQDRALADQISRASKAVPLHIVEGISRRGRDRGHLLTVAIGSTNETHAGLDVALAAGIITAVQHVELAATCRAVAPMLVRLRG